MYIADKVREAGGRTFFVGGFVRDRILWKKNDPEDIDIEVHGILPQQLRAILAGAGEPLIMGQSFGIYSLKGEEIDIAMPRREKALAAADGARRHRDFDVEVDPFIGTYEAARRRDFTINALMEDVLTAEILDHLRRVGALIGNTSCFRVLFFDGRKSVGFSCAFFLCLRRG